MNESKSMTKERKDDKGEEIYVPEEENRYLDMKKYCYTHPDMTFRSILLSARECIT